MQKPEASLPAFAFHPNFPPAIAFRYLWVPPNRGTMPEPGGSMKKAIRTALTLVFSLLLLSAMTMAQASGKTTTKTTTKTSAKTSAKSSPKTSAKSADQQHHSKLSKAAFWKHDKTSAK